MPLYYPPSQNGLQKTLGADLNTGTTSGVTLNNTTGVQNYPGVFVVNRIDTDGNEKDASLREYVAFTAVSGSTLTTLTRGLGGSSDQDHSTGDVVEFIPDVVWAQAVVDSLANLVNTTTLALDTTKVVDLTTSQTLSSKTLTSPVLNTSLSGTAFLDEDTMSSNSATKVASQQSIKAYVDANVGVTPALQTTSSSSTSSAPDTTWADVTSGSLTVSCAVGDTLLIIAHAVVSNSSASGRVDMRIYRDSTSSVANAVIKNSTNLSTIAMTTAYAATSTSHTFKLQYSDQLASGGTVQIEPSPYTKMNIVNLKQ